MARSILFLAARLEGPAAQLADAEARAVQIELERSGAGDELALQTRWAVTPDDLLRELSRSRAAVVHFRGRAAVATGAEPAGVVLQDERGALQRVSVNALAHVLAATGASAELVVLSACYSDALAPALLSCAPCVVAIEGWLDDAAARAYAVGLYGALAQGESIAAAHGQGCAAVSLCGAAATGRPRLFERPGVVAALRHVRQRAPAAAAGPRSEPTPATYNASFQDGRHAIVAQNSVVNVTQAARDAELRAQAMERARVVTLQYLSDPVGKPRESAPAPGGLRLAALAIAALLFLSMAIELLR